MGQTINDVYQHHLQLHEHYSHGVQFDNFVQMLNIFFTFYIKLQILVAGVLSSYNKFESRTKIAVNFR